MKSGSDSQFKNEGGNTMGNTKTKVKSNYNASLTFFQKVKKYRVLLLMCLPAVLFFLAFSYAPMPGIWVAFVKYNYRDGIFGSKFIGLDNFEFLATSGKLLSLTKNTILYNLAFIILGNFLAVFVAILLNEMRSKWFKKVSQTIMFLPYFISQVLVGILVFNLLNYDTGFVNGILTSLGLERWQPYSDPNVWPPIMIIVYLWQQTGYNSVVYFAAIMGIDGEMMEAAKVDGASTWRTYWKIIFPIMRPMHATVAVLTALAVWNDVMTPLVIMAGSDQNTLPLAQLNFQTQFGTNYNLAFASYLLSLIPILIFYVVCQRQILNGVVNGAVK